MRFSKIESLWRKEGFVKWVWWKRMVLIAEMELKPFLLNFLCFVCEIEIQILYARGGEKSVLGY